MMWPMEVSMTITLKMPAVKFDHFIGSLDAPIVLVEYSDMESPDTARALNVTDGLMSEFRDDLCYVFRHYPIPDRWSNSVTAALALEAAAIQGKFWKMFRYLLSTQKQFSVSHFVDSARMFQLDIDQFISDMESEELLLRIQKDIDSGEESGVKNSVPVFFLNGIIVEGPTNQDLLRDEIRVLLQDQRPHF